MGTRKAETKVQLSSKIFKVDVADNPEAHSRGLSGRSGLGEDQGMLFVFDKPAVHCFWMKDMSFDIDILWFDKSNKLIYQERNVSPSTYPGQRFCPDKQAKYVLEVKAGTAESLDLSQTEELQIFNL